MQMNTCVYDCHVWPPAFQPFTDQLNHLLAGSGSDIGPITDDSALEFFQSDNWAVILLDEGKFCGAALLSHGRDIDGEVSRVQCALAARGYNSSEIAEMLAHTIASDVLRNPLRGTCGITALLNHILSEKLKATQGLKKAA